MSTSTATRPTPATPGGPDGSGRQGSGRYGSGRQGSGRNGSGQHGSGQRVTGWRVLRSEWAKLWSLRSSWITLGLGLLFLIAFGMIASVQLQVTRSARPDARAGLRERHRGEPVAVRRAASPSSPWAYSACWSIGGRSTRTGMIRSTLAAVPRRLPVLWSKAAVFGAVALVVGMIGVGGRLPLRQPVLSDTAVAVSGLSHAGVVRSLLGAGPLPGPGRRDRHRPGRAAALHRRRHLGAGRHAAAGARADVAAADLLADNITPYLPSNAGESIFALHQVTGTLSPGAGLLVLLGWTALALAGRRTG